MIDYPQGQKLNYGDAKINYMGIAHHKQYSALNHLKCNREEAG